MKLAEIGFAVVIAAIAMTMPAYADPITIEFTSAGVPPGDNGGVSYITVISALIASGSNLAISEMIVSGDGSFDGTYEVTGSVGIGYGALSFDTSSDLVQIIGGVTGLVPDGTTLLAGTGPFSNVMVTAPACGPYLCPTVTFDAPDTVAATLLSALGISGKGWTLSSFDTAEGTGNGFPQYSADVVNTGVPEPATLALLGAGLLGLGALRRHKARKAA